MKIIVVSFILDIHELAQDVFPGDLLTGFELQQHLLVFSGEPRPYMHDTLATIMTSRRSSRERVAEWRILSMVSLMEESFAIYVSL